MPTYTRQDAGTPDTEPELTARSGQEVTILRELGLDERDIEVGRMFHVRFPDDHEACVFAWELDDVPADPRRREAEAEGMAQVRARERRDADLRRDLFGESRGPDGVIGQDADYLEQIADARAAAAEITDEDSKAREDPALDYADLMESVAAEYGPKALAYLAEIAVMLRNAGWVVTDPYDLSSDDYRWAINAAPRGVGHGEDGTIDVRIEIAEERAYGDEGWGLNFGLDIVASGGLILGGFQPFNYTEQCWVDARDGEAVARRWAILMDADPSGIPELMVNHEPRRSTNA